MAVVIAIDPGIRGSVAWHFDSSGTSDAESIPRRGKVVDAYALSSLLARIASQDKDRRVMVEKVGGFIAGNARTGSSMFTFGCVYGIIIGVVANAALPMSEVTPQSWQKYLGLGSRNGRTPTQWKHHLAMAAVKLYPHVKVTRQNADALLILEYARNH